MKRALDQREIFELRTDITKCYDRFDRSGHHKNNKYTHIGRLDWHHKYGNRIGKVLQYAVLLLDSMISEVGRALAEGIGCDSENETAQRILSHGANDSYSQSVSAIDKPRYRQKRKSGDRQELDEGVSGCEATTKRPDEVKSDLQLQALMFVATSAGTVNPRKRRKPQEILKQMAFGGIDVGSESDKDLDQSDPHSRMQKNISLTVTLIAKMDCVWAVVGFVETRSVVSGLISRLLR